MPAPLVKLVASLLLVLHGLIASGPARVICIRVFECDAHADHHQHSDHSACEHDHYDHCKTASRDCHQHTDNHDLPHEHAPLGSDCELGSLPSCGCHFHLPIPGCDGLALNASGRGDASDSRAIDLTPTLIAILTWGTSPPIRPQNTSGPPDFSKTDQCLGLRSIRLLI